MATSVHQPATPEARVRFTYDDYVLLSADKRYELIDGDLFMPPAPSEGHQSVDHNLTLAVGNHVKAKKLGKVYSAPFDVVLSDHDTVQPDLLFVSNARKSIITPDNVKGAPDWIAEILSPGSADRDYRAKKKLYAKSGVREYWIIDPVARAVEVHLLKGKTYQLVERVVEKGTVSSQVIEGFKVSLKELFEE
ncbi:MAG: Uma2 family endonuclease [Planctomycetes bacterium]|nr:Uma2 family endonuclease [Planctomycetota bacterium]